MPTSMKQEESMETQHISVAPGNEDHISSVITEEQQNTAEHSNIQNTDCYSGPEEIPAVNSSSSSSSHHLPSRHQRMQKSLKRIELHRRNNSRGEPAIPRDNVTLSNQHEQPQEMSTGSAVRSAVLRLESSGQMTPTDSTNTSQNNSQEVAGIQSPVSLSPKSTTEDSRPQPGSEEFGSHESSKFGKKKPETLDAFDINKPRSHEDEVKETLGEGGSERDAALNTGHEEAGDDQKQTEVAKLTPTPLGHPKEDRTTRVFSGPASASVVTASTASSKPNAFDVALSRTADYKSSEAVDEEQGGRMWKTVVSSSKPPPVPAVARVTRPQDLGSRGPGSVRETESCDGTASTITAPTAYDIAISATDNDTVQDSTKNDGGGRLWELASRDPGPSPTGTHVHAVPAVSVRQTHQGEESCNATSSTKSGPDAFDFAVDNSVDNRTSDQVSSFNEGGRMWEMASAAESSTQPRAVVAEIIRSLEAHQGLKKNDAISRPDLTNSPSTPMMVSVPTPHSEPRSHSYKHEDPVWSKKTSIQPQAPAEQTSPSLDNIQPTDQSPPTAESAFVPVTQESSRNQTPPRAAPLAYRGLGSGSQSSSEASKSSSERSHSSSEDRSSASPDLQACTGSISTPGRDKFEKLRAPTPDAFDIAMSKSDDVMSSEVFEDEDGGSEKTPEKKEKQSKRNDKHEPPSPSRNAVQQDALAKNRLGLKPKSNHAAQQYRRMVQMFVFAIAVSLLGWMSNIFIGESCYLASVPLEMGEYEVEFDMHVGLWKYSPPDSTLAGYSYCTPYGDYHAEDEPIMARTFHIASLVAGSFSLGVLWYFLFTGFSSPEFWKAAAWVSVLAATFELLTLFFYVGKVCQEASCQWGLASSFIPVASFAWIVLALELRFYAPFVSEMKATMKEKNIEMTSVKTLEGSECDYKPPMFVA